MILPVTAAIAWGGRYAVFCVLGGVWLVPFMVNPLFGWANVYTSAMYCVWIISLGCVSDARRSGKTDFYAVYAVAAIISAVYVIGAPYAMSRLAQLNPIEPKMTSFKFISENIINIHTSINVMSFMLYTLSMQSVLAVSFIGESVGGGGFRDYKNNFVMMAVTAFVALFWYALNIKTTSFSYLYISFDKYNLELSRLMRLLLGFDVIYIAGDIFREIYNHHICIYTLEQESRSRYMNIFSNISDMYLEMTEDGKILEASKATLDIFGRGQGEVYGRSISEFFVYSYVAKNIIADIAVGADLRDREIELRRKNGDIAVMLISAAKKIYGGKVVLIARDITNYKRWEKEKVEYETRIRSVFDLCDELIWVVKGKDYTLMNFNRAAQMYFKKRFGAEITVGMSAEQMFGEESGYWIEYYRDTERYGRYYGKYEDKSGEAVYEQCGFVMTKGDGSCDISMFMRDITETIKKSQYMELMNKELEHSVNERVKELAAAYEELNSFSYTVSHELKTPIRAIAAHVQFIKEDSFDSLDEDGRTEVLEIERLCKSTFDMIVKLLEHTKMKTKQIQPSLVDMNSLVDEISEEIKLTNKDKQINIVRYNLPSVVGDEFLLRQVIYNIFSNSVKFAKKDTPTEITVGSFATENENGYYFADRGVGFDMKYSDKLFHMFNRLHSDSEYEGSGIGLYTIKQIIEKHSGSVFIESEENKGCVVGFTLPR